MKKILFILLIITSLFIIGCTIPNPQQGYCGDGICKYLENSQNCQEDCGGMSESHSKAAWGSATPFAITDWSLSENTFTFIIKNNSSETLYLTNIEIATGMKTNFEEDIILASGKSRMLIITQQINCNSGQTKTFPKEDIQILYNTEQIYGKIQSAPHDIIIRCNSSNYTKSAAQWINQSLEQTVPVGSTVTDYFTMNEKDFIKNTQFTHIIDADQLTFGLVGDNQFEEAFAFNEDSSKIIYYGVGPTTLKARIICDTSFEALEESIEDIYDDAIWNANEDNYGDVSSYCVALIMQTN